jgi:hypothetical protein
MRATSLNFVPLTIIITLAKSTIYGAPNYTASQTSWHFISLRFQHSPQQPVLKRPQSIFLPNARDQVLHPYRNCYRY